MLEDAEDWEEVQSLQQQLQPCEKEPELIFNLINEILPKTQTRLKKNHTFDLRAYLFSF